MFKKLKKSLTDSVVEAVDKIETVGNRLSTSAASSVTGSLVSESHIPQRNNIVKKNNVSLTQSTNSVSIVNISLKFK